MSGKTPCTRPVLLLLEQAEVSRELLVYIHTLLWNECEKGKKHSQDPLQVCLSAWCVDAMAKISAKKEEIQARIKAEKQTERTI